MLKRVYADNYRTLVNFELFPGRGNLLLGENGAGKSAVFEVLEGIQNVVVHGHSVADSFPASSLTRWEARDVQRFELDVEGEDGAYHYILELEHHRKASTVAVRREQVEYEGKPIYRFEAKTVYLYNNKFEIGTSFQGDARRSFLAIIEERPENKRLFVFLTFLRSLWILRPSPQLMTAVSQKEASWLERDASNFASWYREKAQELPEEVDLLKSDMREVIGGLLYFRLVPSGGTARDLVATLSAGSGGVSTKYDLALDELSVGQRALLLLYAILHFVAPRATVLCFDEPDNFVALREVKPWLIKLSDIMEENGCQLFMISHHPEVIDYLAATNPIKIERPTGDITRVRPFLFDLDSGLRASEQIARGWDRGSA